VIADPEVDAHRDMVPHDDARHAIDVDDPAGPTCLCCRALRFRNRGVEEEDQLRVVR